MTRRPGKTREAEGPSFRRSAPRASEHRSLLRRIDAPGALARLGPALLTELAEEIRDFLIQKVSKTGGHLGPNLGVVELTIALHRVFDSPRERILFDTGHQSYVHKLLTGRQDFDRLRSRGGLSGYPSRTESEHDVIENSHASTVLGYADGIAKAHALLGRMEDPVVAVIGDGALTGGMAWEALNNIGATDLPVIVVVNDNGRSYSATVGGLARHLAALRAARHAPTAPRSVFENFGLAYIGPVDGHDVVALEAAFAEARDRGGPVVVHCVTEKGRGHPAAENDDADRMHAIGPFRPGTGLPGNGAADRSWTSVFGEEMAAIGREREDVVAITAAMLRPVGLAPFAEAHSERVFDVGIAEQHAVTSAAGLAVHGLHPVVAVYATFLNRAFDQVVMDVALHGCGVTFVLDRAGVTGTDGASHNGMWDMSILQVVPGLRLAAPRDAEQLRAQLREAVEVSDAPTVIRYPKGTAGPAIPSVGRVGGADVLRDGGRAPDVLLVSVGTMASVCLEAAGLLEVRGITSSVVDPRWVKPVDDALLTCAAGHRVVVTVEDNGRTGGIGASIAQAMRDADVRVPMQNLGLPQRFLGHAEREEVLADAGLTAAEIAERAVRLLRRPAAIGGDVRGVPAPGTERVLRDTDGGAD
ncbi:1-deoxy-D-xylulose-5-phosphate synthase [Streptomyces sp. NPDC055607]